MHSPNPRHALNALTIHRENPCASPAPKPPPVVILGVPFDNLTTAQTLQLVEEMLASRRPHHLVTANVDFLVQALEDLELHRILLDAHLVLCDGMPLVWASRLLGNPLPERVAGSDLVPLLIKVAAQRGYRIFFLGGTEENTSQAVHRLKAQYPDLKIVGHHSPPFSGLLEMDHEDIRCRIQRAEPDLLFVCFGCPKQEKWIAMHYRTLGVPVCVGVGATIDFLAGRIRRAPLWMRQTGTEWLYRLFLEPRRLLGRYVRDISVFSRSIILQWWHMQASSPTNRRTHITPAFKSDDWNRITLPRCLNRKNAVYESLLCENAFANGRNCLLDGSGVEFLDSTGMATLVRLRKASRTMNCKLVLFAPSVRLSRALHLMHLDRFFLVAPDVQELKALQRRFDDRPVLVQPNYFPSKPSIYWQGEITAANSELVWRRTINFITSEASRQQKFLIDLSALHFIDTTGVGMMLRAKTNAIHNGLELIFTGIQPTVRNILKMARVDSFLLRT